MTEDYRAPGREPVIRLQSIFKNFGDKEWEELGMESMNSIRSALNRAYLW